MKATLVHIKMIICYLFQPKWLLFYEKMICLWINLQVFYKLFNQFLANFIFS